MKKRFFLFFCLLQAVSVFSQYDSQNITLLSHWYNPLEVPEPQLGVTYQSVWGWVDTSDNNKEYAILGSASGTYIIDISNPSTPVERDFVAGRRNQCVWREYKTFGNYLYAVSDDAAPNSLQIMDLSYLPDSVHVVYDDTTLFIRSHTIFIDGDKLYCGSVSKTGIHYSMAVYSLANPELPELLRTLNQDDSTINHVHDMFVRNDTIYASCGYQGLFIYKLNTDTTLSLINSLTSYPQQGYNHSSSLSANGKTLVFCDEVPRNLSVKAMDVTDLQNMSIESTFKSNEGATPHNPYIVGNNKLVLAYYQDGIQIFNIKNPANPTRSGYFDTDTLDGVANNYNPTGTPYHGCWGAYVNLPSGVLLASDMQNGLFVLDATVALSIDNEVGIEKNTISVYPNPFNDEVSVSITGTKPGTISIQLFDITGRKLIEQQQFVVSGTTIKTITAPHLSQGVYILKINGTGVSATHRVIKK